MPWCPKCKQEYHDGIDTCSDCDEVLVTDKPEPDTTCVAYFQEEEIANRFLGFLKYSDITNSNISFLEVQEEYGVYVTNDKVEEARKLLQAFLIAQEEEEEQEEEKEPVEDMDSPELEEEEFTSSLYLKKDAKLYTPKRAKYEDLKSTAFTFTLFGILGILFTTVNLLGYLHLFQNWLQFGVMYLVSLIFCIVGFSSYRQSKTIYKQIGEEELMTEELNTLLNETSSEEQLKSIENPAASREMNDLKKMQHMKKVILDKFPTLDDTYVEYVVEHYYESIEDKE